MVGGEVVDHLREDFEAADGVDDACLEDVGVVEYGAVALSEGEDYGDTFIVGVSHYVGHFVAVRGSYDDVGGHGCGVELVDGFEPVVGVEDAEGDVGAGL